LYRQYLAEQRYWTKHWKNRKEKIGGKGWGFRMEEREKEGKKNKM